MEQNITTNTQTPTPQIEPAQKMETAEPKKNSSFLVILLSILLIISVLIAGFFAYQTQNLVKEITKLQVIPTPITSTEPIPTTDPTTDWKVHIFSKIGLSIALPEKWYTHKEVLGSPDGGYGSWISYPVDNPSSQSVEVEGLIATLYLFSYENPEKSLDQDATYRLNQPGAEPGTEKFESELGGEKSINEKEISPSTIGEVLAATPEKEK